MAERITSYDPLRTLREVHAILSEPAHTRTSRERRRTNAIIAMAGTLGYHDRIERDAMMSHPDPRWSLAHRERGRCPIGDDCPCWQEGYRDGSRGQSGREEQP